MDDGQFRSDLFYRSEQSTGSTCRPCRNGRETSCLWPGVFLADAAGGSARRSTGSPRRWKSRCCRMPGRATCVSLRNEVERAVINCTGSMISLGQMFSLEGHRPVPAPALRAGQGQMILKEWQTGYLSERLRETGGQCFARPPNAAVCSARASSG